MSPAISAEELARRAAEHAERAAGERPTSWRPDKARAGAPEGRHARLHTPGVRNPRHMGRVRAPRGRRPWRQPRQPDEAHEFRDKYRLPFTLLADVDHSVAEAYGVWVEKSMLGKKYMGIERSTFVMTQTGTWPR